MPRSQRRLGNGVKRTRGVSLAVSFRQPLSRLDSADVANLDKAQRNVEALTLEILQKLTPQTEMSIHEGVGQT